MFAVVLPSSSFSGIFPASARYLIFFPLIVTAPSVSTCDSFVGSVFVVLSGGFWARAKVARQRARRQVSLRMTTTQVRPAWDGKGVPLGRATYLQGAALPGLILSIRAEQAEPFSGWTYKP